MSTSPTRLLGQTRPGVCLDAVYEAPLAEGYRGIWYAITSGGGGGPEPWRANKYGGAMATYPQQHAPIAEYRKDDEAGIERTYFVYGGEVDGREQTANMIGYFDHRTGRVVRPRAVLTRRKRDAHENPVLGIDDQGYLWVFSPGHGQHRRSMISRSAEPYEIDRWIRVLELPGGDEAMAYPQPHFLPGRGLLLLLHTRYAPGSQRTLVYNRSRDGTHWDFAWGHGEADSRPGLAWIERGHYQMSWRFGQTVSTMFNFHPEAGEGAALDRRTNLYYLETYDGGQTWNTADGRPCPDLPLSEPDNPALVWNTRSVGLNVYLKDIQRTSDGCPVLLFLTSPGSKTGPTSEPRRLWTARYDRDQDRWDLRPALDTSHNYDHGSLYIESTADRGERWRLIGPWLEGPQPYGTGGQIGQWISDDQGQTWQPGMPLTNDSNHNHSYVRRPMHAHPEFYGLWSAGHAWTHSDVSLYFTDDKGKIYLLPRTFRAGEMHQKLS